MVILYIRDEETQQLLQFMQACNVMQVCSVNVVISWMQYVSVKLQQVMPIHRLRMPAGNRVIILTPIVNVVKWSRNVIFI